MDTSEPQPKRGRIKFQPIESSPDPLVILSSEVFRKAAPRLQNETTLSGFVGCHRSARMGGSINGVAWMVNIRPNITVDEVIETCDGMVGDTEKDAKIIIEMKQELDKTQDIDGKVAVTLKRIRDKHGRWKYGVMARFTSGIQVSDVVLDSAILKQASIKRGNQDIIFLKPRTACVEHACDDLFKTNRANGKTFYIPYRGVIEAGNALKKDEHGVAEYQLEKTPESSLKQDNENYLLVAIQGGFREEPDRIRVSDFFASK